VAETATYCLEFSWPRRVSWLFVHSHDMHAIEAVARTLAARQAGVVGRWQVVAAGGDDTLLHRWLRSGRWVATGRPGVVQLSGAPPVGDRALWIAHLAAGPDTVVGFEAAAERHGLAGIPTGRLTLIDRHGRHHRLRGVVVHQLDDVLDHHIEVVGGLPTTTVPRTLLDVAVVFSVARLRLVVEGAVNGRRTSLGELWTTLSEVARRGKPGVAKLARVLDERGPGEPVPATVLERMLLRALLRGGCPPPVAQFPHPGRQPGKGRVDYAYPDAKVILEADGRRWHQRIADLKRDRARDNEAARAGWLTLRFMYEELESDPDDIAATVRDVLADRGSELEVIGIENRHL
jgi:hypothetical protein